jgi:hypothetical protein
MFSADMELFDQGKQSNSVHVPEWFGPPEFEISVPGIGIGFGDKGDGDEERR